MNLYEILAQSVEHLTFNQGVPGSIPGYLRIRKSRTIIYCPGFFYIHRGRELYNGLEVINVFMLLRDT